MLSLGSRLTSAGAKLRESVAADIARQANAVCDEAREEVSPGQSDCEQRLLNFDRHIAAILLSGKKIVDAPALPNGALALQLEGAKVLVLRAAQAGVHARIERSLHEAETRALEEMHGSDRFTRMPTDRELNDRWQADPQFMKELTAMHYEMCRTRGGRPMVIASTPYGNRPPTVHLTCIGSDLPLPRARTAGHGRFLPSAIRPSVDRARVRETHGYAGSGSVRRTAERCRT